MRNIFVSGHLDLTNEEFAEHYAPRIDTACADQVVFHVGDARGADFMAQEFLESRRVPVVVYHMFDKPRNLYGSPYRVIGGFTSDNARDAAMTAATTEDIAWVRPGREKSGTARNLARREVQYGATRSYVGDKRFS